MRSIKRISFFLLLLTMYTPSIAAKEFTTDDQQRLVDSPPYSTPGAILQQSLTLQKEREEKSLEQLGKERQQYWDQRQREQKAAQEQEINRRWQENNNPARWQQP